MSRLAELACGDSTTSDVTGACRQRQADGAIIAVPTGAELTEKAPTAGATAIGAPCVAASDGSPRRVPAPIALRSTKLIGPLAKLIPHH
jgi:hypothetical protein